MTDDIIKRLSEAIGWLRAQQYIFDSHPKTATDKTPGSIADNIAALLDRLDAADEMRNVLLRNGFVECDIPACNCGSWHHRYGLPERFREIKDALADAGHEMSNENGNSALGALKALIAQRDAAERENERLRKFAGKVLDKSRRGFLEVSCGDIEDWAKQFGLLGLVTMSAACGDDCKCPEWVGFPLECLRPTALGSAAINAARAAEPNDRRDK